MLSQIIDDNPQRAKKRKLITRKYHYPKTMSDNQKKAMNHILQGNNVLITGSAGTGKSFIIHELVDFFPKQSTFVTACTGVAASHFNGTTINYFAGIGKGDLSADYYAKKILNNQDTLKRWRRCRLLVIDEVSMLDANLFNKLEEIARKVRNPRKCFGGIQLVLCGDFFQLPPVWQSNVPHIQRKFCFESFAWEKCELKIIELKQIFRQKIKNFKVC